MILPQAAKRATCGRNLSNRISHSCRGGEDRRRLARRPIAATRRSERGSRRSASSSRAVRETAPCRGQAADNTRAQREYPAPRLQATERPSSRTHTWRRTRRWVDRGRSFSRCDESHLPSRLIVTRSGRRVGYTPVTFGLPCWDFRGRVKTSEVVQTSEVRPASASMLVRLKRFRARQLVEQRARRGGHGLGLSIVKRIVGAVGRHGGRR